VSVIDRVSLWDQIAEVKREIDQRKRVYVRMIAQEKMTKAEAERRMTVMCAVLATLERLRGLGNKINDEGEPNDSRGGIKSTAEDGP
jgi:hypothetical protein